MSSKVKSSAATGSGRALVPKLRFPEFQNTGGWKSKRLGHFLSESRLPGSKGDVARKITVKLWGGGVFAKNEAIQGSANTQYFQRKSGQLIYSKLDFLNQAFGIIPDDLDGYESTADLPCFDISADLNPAFILECVKQKGFYRKVGEAADGSRIAKRIHPETLLASEIPLPSLPEQQKIADCLDSADALIAAQGRKVEALRAHKKGLMQQLFPQEGETQPSLRFPEFKGAEEWVEDTLGNLFDITSGGTPERSREDYWNGGIPWITTSLVNFNVIAGAAEYISEAGLKNSSAKIFPEKTILVAMYGQGKTRGQVAMLGLKAATNQACAAILPRKGINQKFVFLNLVSRYEELRGISNSGGQENISQGLIKGLSFSYPSDPAEQQSIADCLTSLDDLIAAETRKLDTLKIHKKGLMQQLFPMVGGG